MDFAPPILPVGRLDLEALTDLARYYQDRVIRELVLPKAVVEIVQREMLVGPTQRHTFYGIPVRLAEAMPRNLFGVVDGHGELHLCKIEEAP